MKEEKHLRRETNRRVYQDTYSEYYGNIKRRKKGCRGHWKSKKLWQWQVRMYRTWKHTRKTQWKPF